MPRSRRHFLQSALAAGAAVLAGRQAPAGQRGLDQFMVPMAPCKNAVPTPAVARVPFFKAGSPARASLVGPDTPGERLVLAGVVSGVSCGALVGARLDFWQADSKGQYDEAGFRFRGHQMSDAAGRYRLETVVPGPHGGRTRLLNVRIDARGKILTTQVFFPGEALNAKDPAYRPELEMKAATPAPGAGGRAATFDFLLDV
jgi:protocatechuate 3,4-dioxygenase beta subunit